MAEKTAPEKLEDVDFSSRNLSNIRNKKRRQELYQKLKFEQSKAKTKLKKAKKKLVEEQGNLLSALLLWRKNNILLFI